MRKWLAMLVGVLMLLTVAVVPVAAETTAPADVTEPTVPVADAPAVTESMQIFQKTYTLHMDQYRGEIVSDTQAAAFWEYPVFAKGQRYTVDGLLVIRNDSHMVADVKLDNVSLPYGDEQKMNYLNHLMITVTELSEDTATTTTTAADGTVPAETAPTSTETVVFDGPYSRINDVEGGLHLVYENMQPDEEHTYRINMRCLYTYDGDPNTDTSWLKWNFSAHSRMTVIYEEEQGLPEWARLTIIIFAATIAVLIVIMIVTGIVSLVKNAKERKAAKLEDRDIKAQKKAEKQRRKEEKRAQKEAAKRLKEQGMYRPSPDDVEEETDVPNETPQPAEEEIAEDVADDVVEETVEQAVVETDEAVAEETAADEEEAAEENPAE